MCDGLRNSHYQNFICRNSLCCVFFFDFTVETWQTRPKVEGMPALVATTLWARQATKTGERSPRTPFSHSAPSHSPHFTTRTRTNDFPNLRLLTQLLVDSKQTPWFCKAVLWIEIKRVQHQQAFKGVVSRKRLYRFLEIEKSGTFCVKIYFNKR